MPEPAPVPASAEPQTRRFISTKLKDMQRGIPIATTAILFERAVYEGSNQSCPVSEAAKPSRAASSSMQPKLKASCSVFQAAQAQASCSDFDAAQEPASCLVLEFEAAQVQASCSVAQAAQAQASCSVFDAAQGKASCLVKKDPGSPRKR